MTALKEFQAARDYVEKHAGKVLLFIVVRTAGWVILGLTIREFGKPWLGANIAEFAPALSFAIGIPFMIWGFTKLEKHRQQFPELQCPHCKKSLARGASIVIASGNCFHCGERVIDSEE